MEVLVNEKYLTENRNKTYTIGQVSLMTGMTDGTIRSAEKELGELLSVSRDEQQNREFTRDDIVMLKKINSVRKWGIGSYKAMKIMNEKMNLFDIINENGDIVVDTFNIGLKSSISNGIEERELNYQHSTFSIGDEKLAGALEMISALVADKLGKEISPQLNQAKELILQEIAIGNSKLETIQEHTSEIAPKFEEVNANLGELKDIDEQILDETKKTRKEFEEVYAKFKKSEDTKLKKLAKKLWG